MGDETWRGGEALFSGGTDWAQVLTAFPAVYRLKKHLQKRCNRAFNLNCRYKLNSRVEL